MRLSSSVQVSCLVGALQLASSCCDSWRLRVGVRVQLPLYSSVGVCVSVQISPLQCAIKRVSSTNLYLIDPYSTHCIQIQVNYYSYK